MNNKLTREEVEEKLGYKLPDFLWTWLINRNRINNG